MELYKYTMVHAEKLKIMCSNFLWHIAAGFSVLTFSYHSLSYRMEDRSVPLEYTLHVTDSYFDTNMSSICVRGDHMSKNLKVMFHYLQPRTVYKYCSNVHFKHSFCGTGKDKLQSLYAFFIYESDK